MTTTLPAALGTYPNAPLVFVLAQVRFLPSSQIDLDAMRNNLRKELPEEFAKINAVMGFNMTIEHVIEVGQTANGKQVVLGYDFQSIDQKAVVRLAADAVTLAVNKYTNFPDFLKLWSTVMATLGTLGVNEVMRVGLRYVDFIYPREGKVPEDYMQEPFDYRKSTAVTGAIGVAETSVHMQEYAFEEGRMRIQYARGIGQPALPLELQGLQDVAPVHSRVSHFGPTAILDTDRWIDGPRPSDVDSLQKDFRLLHTDLSNAFKQLTTQMAQSEWANEMKAA